MEASDGGASMNKYLHQKECLIRSIEAINEYICNESLTFLFM
jgi:hypothetical protein